MNHSFSLIASLGLGIVIGVLLEKQFSFDLSIGSSKSGGENVSGKRNGGLYDQSERYQDQSKAGKEKGLTKEAKTGNVE